MKTIWNCSLATSESANAGREQHDAFRAERPRRPLRTRAGIHAATALVAACAAFAVTACSSDDSNPAASTTGSGGSDTTTATTGSGGTTMTGGSGGAAGGTSSMDSGSDAGPLTAQFVAQFDPTKGQVPEGLAIRDGIPYLGFAATSEVTKVNLADGTFTTIATLPKPAAGTGFMTGLSFSAKSPGVLYVALVSFAPEVQPGIYQVAAEGGAPTLFAKDPAMPFPNGLVTDDQGNWFVADSTGIVFRISADGKTVEKWATGDLLVGDKDKSCLAMSTGSGLPFPIGANGIVKNGDSYYVTNTDKGLIARIPVGADGKAGTISLFAGPDCATLGGADGLTVRGTDLVAADNFKNQIVRIGPTGSVTTIVAGAPLDFPASVTFEQDTLYVTNFAFLNAQTGKGNPGLMRIDFTNR